MVVTRIGGAIMFRKHKVAKDVKSYSETYLEPERPSPIVKQMQQQYRHRMFDHQDDGHQHDNSVNVNIIMNEKEESDIVGCFKACFGCIGSAAKSGSGA